ncbi:MAG: L-2-amino-thiazoline-4-carboxylic acid hydrolase [Hyphomicrobiales bacterium]|nr:L-2-amino-thiazoline-4-carboxylic acid hydrolase [Hyphomicrobiales bacterium]
MMYAVPPEKIVEMISPVGPTAKTNNSSKAASAIFTSERTLTPPLTPMDFVYSFVEGDEEDIDYGVDMTECAIQKFLKKQYAEKLVPYMCALDNALSIRFNRGLVRTKTFVESNVCDFRYKRDRETKMALPKGLKT